MRSLILLVVCAFCATYFSSNAAHAMMMYNPTVAIPDTMVPDIDIDCDFNPDTGDLSNCKAVGTSNE